ncbi:MAG: DUF1538 domain-containing protein [Ruminococcaceae bacterium]|nr:DUF1538 domain-containing protein [Oscillospiraceae bacterium]
MNRMFIHKLRESLLSVMPLSVLVVLLNLTPLVHFSMREVLLFSVSSLLLVLGIALFNLGADLAMTPMGEHVGAGLTKSARLSLLLSVCFMLGVLITVAEPDLTVLAEQVSAVIDPTLLTVAVGVGVGLFLLLGVLKIVFSVSLSSMLMFFYMTLFAVAALVISTGKAPMLSMGFDSGGVTTGPITVPFIMALGVGIAASVGGKHAGENSFGLIALCSVGPILAVLFLSVFSEGNLENPIDPSSYAVAEELLSAAGETLGSVAWEVFLALGLVVCFFFIIDIIFLRLPKKRIEQILIGALFTYVGLVVFLSSVHIGFMPIGYKLGASLATESKSLLLGAAFILGLVVVLAEPAVHVLKKQVEDITDGTVSAHSMLLALSIGVGVSLLLSAIRIVFDFSLLYYLIPGYLISLGLSFFVPRMYTAIAFDSGGVASGPLTSSFILPFAIGACMALDPSGESVLANGFGIVAMVAMTPLITIQMLGFRAVVKRRRQEKIALRRILTASDAQIIEFI